MNDFIDGIVEKYGVDEKTAHKAARMGILYGISIEDGMKLVEIKEVDRKAIIALSKACSYSIDKSIETLDKMKTYSVAEKAV